VGRTRFDYNKDLQVEDVLHSDNRNIAFTYESSGRLKSMSLGSVGSTSGRRSISYGYDFAGRVTDVNRSDSVTVHTEYDGSLVTDTTWTGAIVGAVTATYDENLFLASLTVNDASTVSFAYDKDGLITQAQGNGNTYSIVRAPDTGFVKSATLGETTTSYDYNGFGELKTLTADFPSTGGFKQTLERDKLGRIKAITETVGTTTREIEFNYDDRGRLTSETRDGVVTDYAYDANGNRTSVKIDSVESLTAEYDEQDRITRYGDTTFEQTFHGDLQRKSDGTSSLELAYDELANLMTATVADESGVTELEYVVDGMGRRVAKRVDGSFSKSWLYRDQLRPVSEVDADGTFMHFVYADGFGAPDFILRAGVPLRVVKDHLGSVRLVVDATSGVVLQQLEYDAFGQVLVDTNPGFQPFGFAGGLYDPDTGLVRFGARDYDAEIGRWTAKDPIGFEGRDANLYGYVMADPINATDSSGLVGDFLGWNVSGGGPVFTFIGSMFGWTTPSGAGASAGVFKDFDFSTGDLTVGVYGSTSLLGGISGWRKAGKTTPFHAGAGTETGLFLDLDGFKGDCVGGAMKVATVAGAEVSASYCNTQVLTASAGGGVGAFWGLFTQHTEIRGIRIGLSGISIVR